MGSLEYQGHIHTAQACVQCCGETSCVPVPLCVCVCVRMSLSLSLLLFFCVYMCVCVCVTVGMQGYLVLFVPAGLSSTCDGPIHDVICYEEERLKLQGE